MPLNNSPFVLHCPWLHVSGMALWPFILIREKDELHNRILIHHERIHHRQQLELCILPFYLIYIIEYFYHLLRCRNSYAAYMRVSFEREAHAMDTDLDYLKHRRPYAWVRMFHMKR